mmetsp:Transcript_121896/g.351971  ORF Transcript_121896/g.351971 Transcript_121896/m.351971 type:complete len:340 (-) Transcript_121896:1481-2500(-)
MPAARHGPNRSRSGLHVSRDHPLSVDRPKAGIGRGVLLLLDDTHIPRKNDNVLVDLQLPPQDAPRTEELVLVRPAFRTRQPVQPGLGAVAVRLVCLDEDLPCSGILDHHQHDIDDAHQLMCCRVLLQCGFSTDQLGGELPNGLAPVLPELRNVDAGRHQVVPQRLLGHADGGSHQSRDRLGRIALELDLLGLGCLVGHPLEELGVASLVGGAVGREGWQPDLVQDRPIRQCDDSLDHLLPVHRANARVRWGLDLLLLALYMPEVELRRFAGHAAHILEDALGHLAGVLIGLLLCARKAVRLTLAAIRVFLLGLDEEPMLLVGRSNAQEHDVYHAHQLLV